MDQSFNENDIYSSPDTEIGPEGRPSPPHLQEVQGRYNYGQDREQIFDSGKKAPQ